MKNKIKLTSLMVAVLMAAVLSFPVFAQSETDPLEDPSPVEQSISFAVHPIVKLLADFFAQLFAPPAAELPDGQVISPSEPAGEGGTGGDVPVEGSEVLADPPPARVPEETVAALHEEEKLGFGEMTKLLQIAVEAQAGCTLEGSHCDVNLDGLVAEYKAGTGMGDLFQKYGKPENTGVGQVRKAVETNSAAFKEKSNNGKAKGKKYTSD